MDKVLQGTEKFTGVYLDDVVICSNEWDEHLQHIEEVLERLQQAELTIKMSKCKFLFNSCSYLGYQIGNCGVLPEIAKVKAIEDMMEPKTKKDVRAFLGLTEYY